MSRIGRMSINVPESVKVEINSAEVVVTGPKGTLKRQLHRLVRLNQDNQVITVDKVGESKLARSLYGTYQRLVQNMVLGVTTGFSKNLELVGTGYRVAKQGNKIVLSLGYSHSIDFPEPEGIQFKVEGNNKIEVAGSDKELVGLAAAKIRALRPPEPYKGKGIRYSDEVVRRKAGKAAKAGA